MNSLIYTAMLKQVDLLISLSGSKEEEIQNSTRHLIKKYSPGINQESSKMVINFCMLLYCFL